MCSTAQAPAREGCSHTPRVVSCRPSKRATPRNWPLHQPALDRFRLVARRGRRAYKVLWIAVSATSAPQRRQHPSWCPTTLVSASLSALVAISRFHLLVWWWLAHGEVEGQLIGAAIGQVYPLAAMWAHQVGRPRTAAKGPGRSSAPGSPSIHPSPAVFDLHTLRGLALNDLPNHVGCHAARHVRGEKSSAFSTGS